ncbi:hypothetical protein FCG40_03880 [Fimbriimonadia bacterium ATM]|nr:MAG: hypothetical protein EDM73_02825 [Armatimonadota bacterium]MBC6968571.1 hypothetical protein [Armatimonadota bacterium]MCE7898590.1 hypothetical protein [Armatimonadetes bacterium ATM1]MDL1928117.1 hypothetical protein [Fimbriimonadia bacterium ATM]RIJ98317.1 MAG: hypothetical protein DCC45_00690 [Armatimonadota bacterium]
MRALFVALAGLMAVAASAQYTPIPRPWEITVGASFPTGDLDDPFEMDTGMLLGVDFYWNQFAPNTQGFFGFREHWADSDAGNLQHMGIHYGAKFNFSQGGSSGNFYGKAAVGYFSSSIDAGSVWVSDFDFGGWLALGFDFMSGGSSWSLELGFMFMPEVVGFDQQFYYAGASFRL